MKFSRKEVLVFVAILALFLAVRLPAVHRSYHQDEYKWPIIVNPALTEPGGIPHPPVGEFIYKIAGQTVGYDNFRFAPLLFSCLNLLLLFYLVKNIANTTSAFIGIFLFTISFYSVLASLMVDTDGAIMPFFFLLSAISYYKLRISNFQIDKTKWKWLLLFVISVIFGFLVKLSFLVGVAALVFDFALEKNIFADRRKVLKYFGIGAASTIGLVALLFASKFIFPYFQLESSIKYWEHFWNSSSFFDRGWLQTFIQFFKSILYTSPLLFLPVFFVDKEIWSKTRPLFLFIFIGLFFYLFAFDFSIGALDRYFQFLVVPLCVISGIIAAKLFEDKNVKFGRRNIIMIFAVAILIFGLQLLSHFVPPLHPKAEWVARVISLKWNFLYPFTGGSGPLGFYVSFLFMAAAWILSVIFIASGLLKSRLRKIALLATVFIGLVYNGVFVEEYLFGKINGSAPQLLAGAAAFIRDNSEIKKVTVYNDNGGYEIQKTGKYRKRLYVDPAFGVDAKIATLNEFKEHYLEINIPRIDPNSFYRKYFDSCIIAYKQTDRSISATVYDCRNAPDLKP